MNNQEHEYDGFYFLPFVEKESDDEELKFVLFKFQDEYADGEKIGGNAMGDEYHIAFFRENENGHAEFDVSFDAILGDPLKYAEGLIGSNLYGCIVRKTTKSTEWFQGYLKRVLQNITITNLKIYAENLQNN